MRRHFVLMNADPGAAGGGVGGAGPGGAPAGGPGAPAPTWYAGFADEGLRSWVASKGLPNAEEAVRSYHNAERFLGAPADELVRVPKNPTTADEFAVFDRLGRPKESAGYELDTPAGAGDERFVEWAKTTFHKIGLTGRQGKEVSAAWNAYMTEQNAARVEEYTQVTTAEELQLKQEWGAGFERQMETARRAAQQFGFTGEAVDALEQAMGYKAVVKFMANLGSKMGAEHEFIPGGPGKFGDALTPAEAQAQITAKRADSGFVKRYTEGDTTARAEMERLHRLAYPE